jgi:hypothetical protein
MFSSEQWLANSGSNFYNGVIGQSLRLSVGSNYKLDRQMVTPTSVTGTICTASWWMKKGNGNLVTSFINCRDNQASGNYCAYWTYASDFGSNNSHQFYNETNSINVGTNATVTPYRDVSAWYHVVIRYDSTQSTASNRIRIYINGVNQVSTFATTNYIGQNVVDTFWNNAGEHLILFGNGEDSGDNFDGYIAEFNWVDGLSLAPESFGELKNGVWIPIEYTGSYGLNGSRYTFADSSDIGKDTSGVGNHLDRVSNLSASDVVPDSPENNFATMNATNTNTNLNLSEGNLKIIPANTGDYYRSMSTLAIPTSGKWYWEVRLFVAPYVYQFGLYDVNGSTNQRARTVAASVTSGQLDYQVLLNDGTASINTQISVEGAAFGAWTSDTFGDGDVASFAYDADNNKMWMAKNGTFLNTSGTADPATGADPRFTPAANTEYYVGASMPNPASGGVMFNFGQDSTFTGQETATSNADANGIGAFHHAPPSGFLALCTANLPEPTIGANSLTQADDYFNTVLYTGNGGTQNITGFGFQPDWIWDKSRNQSGSHMLVDSSRGVGKYLRTNVTSAEVDDASILTHFISDGVTVGDINGNASGSSSVMWGWKANGGTTSSNSDGSVTTTIQANTTSGFSIVLYTGTGANATFGHGLGAVPKMIITKTRSTSGDWMVYHGANTSAPQTDFLKLNATNATEDLNTVWNDTAPTSSVFTLGSNGDVNTSGRTQVAYCFAEVEGYSKIGSYTGNGSADGTFVFTGFRPAFVMLKDIGGGEWGMFDSARNTFNVVNKLLQANVSDAEYSGDSNRDLDFLSNGFKLRNGSALVFNGSSRSLIYMAFAESPFKYANAR